MTKLIGANLMRLKKDKVFWVCVAVMALVGAAVALITGGSDPTGFSIDRTFFAYTLPLEFACAVFCSLFIGTDYSDGTIRGKLIVGHSRRGVYLSNLAVCALAGLVFGCAYIIPMLAIGIPRLGFFEADMATVLAMTGITVMMMLCVCSIFTLISMLCQNRAVVAVVCLIGMIFLLVVAVVINGRLLEPEVYDSYVYTDNSGAMAEAPSEPNPNYLSGAKRSVCQFALEFSPAGQALMFSDRSNLVRLWTLPLYSLFIILLTTAAGLYAFRKKDIR